MTIPIAHTTSGPLRGREKDDIWLFAGVPYAAPPTGSRRFRPPEPPEAASAVLDATAFGAVSWQAGGALGGFLSQGTPDCDEDCLTLNIQTPGLDDRRRPVMVWIHGGGFTGGTGATPWYNGRRFARDGNTVVVTINYRLGALGFLHLAELGGNDYVSSGLSGILDQVAALRWVHDNIGVFGGDPDNVTIFGESAGAMSVATLLGLPAASGLFHRAIAQSGAAHNIFSTDDAQAHTRDFCELGGFSSIDELLRTDAATILDVQQQLSAAMTAGGSHGHAGAHGVRRSLGMPFQPVVDGHALPEPPIEAVRKGAARDVTLLCGTTAEEWKLFGLMAKGPSGEESLQRRSEAFFGSAGAELLGAYRGQRPGADVGDVWSAMLSDAVFRIPSIRLAEAQAVHRPDDTRMYLFSWASRAFEGKLGSCHALEIPFVFDSLDAPGVSMFLGEGPAPTALADAMHTSWLCFAQTGDPAHTGVGEWPAYDTAKRATMIFGDTVGVQHDPHSDERVAWDNLL